MRFIVYGAGAVGGVIGARLFKHGHDTTLIARGDHYAAIRRSGLRIESPDAVEVLPIPVADHPRRLAFQDGDVVLLTAKSQDSALALRALATMASASLPVVCVQNGVENERAALRLFPDVYGVCVMCPAAHLAPGVVQAFSAPTTGILDVGRYPVGVDAVAVAIAEAFRASSFSAEARVDIMRWKYTKLLNNLGNAVEAICGPAARQGEIGRLAQEEGAACLVAAGIDRVGDEEDAARRGSLVTPRPIAGRRRPGGSSWQSLSRGAGSVETDYLNGEIVLLGRAHGVPTPVNSLLQLLANRMAANRSAPGSVSPQEFLAQLAKTV